MELEETPTILVVDDDEFFRKMIIAILQKSSKFPDANYIEAEDGEAAWNIAQEKKPSAVLLDLVMPKMDGKQLAQKLREKYPDLPIMILTGQPEENIKKDLVNEVKIDGYLEKTVDQSDLIDEMGRIMDIPLLKLS